MENQEVIANTNNAVTSKRGSFAWILHLTYICAFIILSYGAYLIQQNHDNSVRRLMDMLGAQHTKSMMLENDLQHLKQQLVSLQQNDHRWTLKEIQYLFNLAQMRLHLLGDVDTAIAQLESAQQRLNQLADPSLLPVRQQLAKDIGTLQAYQPINQEDVWLKLSSLSHSIAKINLEPVVTNSKIENEEGQSSQATDSNSKGWQSALNNSWQELKSMVRVRHHEQSQLVAALNMSDRQHLQQICLSLVEQAKWAVLHRDVIVYEQSLQSIQEALQSFVAIDHQQIDGLLVNISSLQKIDIAPDMPTIGVVSLPLTQEA